MRILTQVGKTHVVKIMAIWKNQIVRIDSLSVHKF